MERARNSDSETHVEMLNWTSRTALSGKLLCCIFFGTPCIFVQIALKDGEYGEYETRNLETLSFGIIIAS